MTVIIVRASRYIIARYPTSLLLIDMFRLRLKYLAVGVIWLERFTNDSSSSAVYAQHRGSAHIW